MSTRLTQRLDSRYTVQTPAFGRTRKNRSRTLEELNAILPPLLAALAGGASVREALELSCEAASGELAAILRYACSNAELGERFESALERQLAKNQEPAVQEMSTKLILSHRLGTGLVSQLTYLATSVDEELNQRRLRLATKRESRMLLPLVFLILPITVAFALYPSLSMIQNTY